MWSLLAAYKHNCREVDPNLVADIAVSATLCQHCLPTHLSMRFVHPATILKPPRLQNCLYCAGSNGELFHWSYSAAICVQHVKLIIIFQQMHYTILVFYCPYIRFGALLVPSSGVSSRVHSFQMHPIHFHNINSL